MSVDLYAIAESLQNARDHIVIAKMEKGSVRYHSLECAKENIRDVIKRLGMKEADNGN